MAVGLGLYVKKNGLFLDKLKNLSIKFKYFTLHCFIGAGVQNLMVASGRHGLRTVGSKTFCCTRKTRWCNGVVTHYDE